MVRLAVWLMAVTGCDVVFGLSSIPTGESVCGPYDPPVPLTFGAGIATPVQFSTNATETNGLVLSGTTLIPLLGAADTWTADPDPLRAKFPSGLVSTRLGASQDVAFASVLEGTSLVVVEYHYVASKWGPMAAATVTQPDLAFDLVPGSEIDLGPNGFHYESVAKHRIAGFGNALSLERATPADYSLWMEDPRALPITDDAATGGPNPLDGVQAQTGLVLVYSAVNASGDVDLFASSRVDRNADFGPGLPFDVSIDSAMDEVEPWVNDTCSNVYFRRRMKGASVDPGTIMVAHQRGN